MAGSPLLRPIHFARPTLNPESENNAARPSDLIAVRVT